MVEVLLSGQCLIELSLSPRLVHMVVFGESWVISGRSWGFHFVTPTGKFGMHICIGLGDHRKVSASDLWSRRWKAMKDLVDRSVILSQQLRVHRAFRYSKELSM